MTDNDPVEGQQQIRQMLRDVLSEINDIEEELDHDADFFVDNLVDLGRRLERAEVRDRERQILKDGYMAGWRAHRDDHREQIWAARAACEEATTNVWIWSDDLDALDSFANETPVTITGAQLRELVAKVRSDERRLLAPGDIREDTSLGPIVIHPRGHGEVSITDDEDAIFVGKISELADLARAASMSDAETL